MTTTEAEDVPALLGIPDAPLRQLELQENTGMWVCDTCGCVFWPDWGAGENGGTYPDRYVPVLDGEPHTPDDCACHAAPYSTTVEQTGGQS